MTSSSSHQRGLHCIRTFCERTCFIRRWTSLASQERQGRGFHTFRHSAASFINSQTGNLKLAQKLLGHATIDLTAGIYTHTNPEEERQAAVAVKRAIYGDLFPNLFPTGNNSSVAAVTMN